MMTLDQIKQKLADRRLDVVAKATEIHRNTLSAIRSGANANPSYETIKAISDYLEGCAE